jgi:threonyl-tRNA synthetase
MIHRAPFGSMERFVAVLLEHCAGDFPLWLATDQFIILPVSEKFNEYAEKVSEFLNNYDIRGLVDDRNEKVGKKIRDAELAKVPFMLIVGEEEVEANTISVRQRGKGDLGKMPYEDFVNLVQNVLVYCILILLSRAYIIQKWSEFSIFNVIYVSVKT